MPALREIKVVFFSKKYHKMDHFQSNVYHHCRGSFPLLLKFVSTFIGNRDCSHSVASATAIVRVWG